MAEHNELGKWGEKQAEQFLISQGLSVVERNYRFQKGEIDLICKSPDQIVFVEVKTRASEFYERATDSISEAKQELLIATASRYLEENGIDLDSRFDVVTVVGKSNPHIAHYKDALRP